MAEKDTAAAAQTTLGAFGWSAAVAVSFSATIYSYLMRSKINLTLSSLKLSSQKHTNNIHIMQGFMALTLANFLHQLQALSLEWFLQHQVDLNL